MNLKPGNSIILGSYRQYLNGYRSIYLERKIPEYAIDPDTKVVFDQFETFVRSGSQILVIGCLDAKERKWINVMAPDGSIGWESEDYWEDMCDVYHAIVL